MQVHAASLTDHSDDIEPTEGALVEKRREEIPKARQGAVAAPCRTRLLSPLCLCLSRACLGRLIVLYTFKSFPHRSCPLPAGSGLRIWSRSPRRVGPHRQLSRPLAGSLSTRLFEKKRQKRHQICLNFIPFVCPEPVLANDRFKIRKNGNVKEGVFLPHQAPRCSSKPVKNVPFLNFSYVCPESCLGKKMSL